MWLLKTNFGEFLVTQKPTESEMHHYISIMIKRGFEPANMIFVYKQFDVDSLDEFFNRIEVTE